MKVNEDNIIFLKSSQIKEIRNKILKEQNYICPLCGKEIREEDAVLDHQHMRKSDKIGLNGNGLVRGVLHRTCNAVEGKIENSIKRYLGNLDIEDKLNFLSNLIEYYKKENYNYVHPNEFSEPKISKRQYNKLKKEYEKTGRRKKFPEFPKSGKMTKSLKEISEEFNISLYLL